MNKVLISFGLLCIPTLSFAVCPINGKQCSYRFVNKTEMNLKTEIVASSNLKVNPAVIPANTTTMVAISDEGNADIGSIKSLKISSPSEGKTKTGNDKSMSDTVIFNIKELKANSPNYALPKSWSEKDNGKTYGSFFHEAKPGVGSLNDYETIEIERASNWELANILKQSKFFTLTGIKTENGREVRVTLY